MASWIPRRACSAALAVLALTVVPEAAQARKCSGGGPTYNQYGDRAVFKSLEARGGMNCASARYVLNKFIRRSFHTSYDDTIVTDFYDGYVDWDCGKLTRTRWECAEYDSYTYFRFTAYLD
jgi:hypothetical protein